jgi:hypothetical protein
MSISRKEFIGASGALLATFSGCASSKSSEPEKKVRIQGFDEEVAQYLTNDNRIWQPFSDKKVRVGIAGEGICDFGSAFGYQDHPNVEVVACAELDSNKLKVLQQRVRAKRAYKSCEDMIKAEAKAGTMDAVYIATDAVSHIRLAIMALEHGMHVTSAVPAFFGKDQLQEIPKLIEAAKRSGKIYMMNETTAFRPQCYAMRKLYKAGYLGEITYSEGEYFHPSSNNLASKGIGSYGGWRTGMPPQYYPTHSNGYYTCVTHKRFTEVTCRGVPSLKHVYSKGNRYNNPYGSEYAMMKCEDGSSARMLVAWDTPSYGAEAGRIWGQKGCFVPESTGYKDLAHWSPNDKSYSTVLSSGYNGWFMDEVKKMDLTMPPLPKAMQKARYANHHGGSHGYLTDDFIRAILLKDHKVCCDLICALNTTIAGVYAHMSAMKDGEILKIPSVV